MSTIKIENGNVSGEDVPEDVLKVLRDPRVQEWIFRCIQEDRAAAGEADEDEEGEDDDQEDENPATTGTPAPTPVPTPPSVSTPNYKKRANKTGSFIQRVFCAIVMLACSIWIGSVVRANCDDDDKKKAICSMICACSAHIVQFLAWESSKKLRLKRSKWTKEDYKRSTYNAILYCICVAVVFSEIWWSFSALNRNHQHTTCNFNLFNCSYDYIITWWVLVTIWIIQPIHSYCLSDFVFFKGK